MNVAVLAGGISPERNISLFGGRAVYNALKINGHNVVTLDPALGSDCNFDINEIEIPTKPFSEEELLQYPKRNIINCINSNELDGIDIVFILLHGENGEDGLVQSLLHLRGIPYTGSGVKASSIAMDKITSKILFQAYGIPTPLWTNVKADEIHDFELLKSIREEIGKDIVIKPSNQGSAVGINIVHGGNLDEISIALKKAADFSDDILIEEYIEGREITVGILDGEPLPIVEIKPKEGYYDFENKYNKGKTEYICPAEIDENLTGFIQGIAQSAAGVTGLSDFSRIDFRLNNEGQPYCLEVNTIPGFTELSLFPMAAKEQGISFAELCDKLIELGLKSSKEGK